MQPRTRKLRHRGSQLFIWVNGSSFKPFLPDCKRDTCSETLENTEMADLENEASPLPIASLSGRTITAPSSLVTRLPGSSLTLSPYWLTGRCCPPTHEGHVAMSGDILGCCIGRRGMLLAPGGQRPGVLLSIFQHTGQSPGQKRILLHCP